MIFCSVFLVDVVSHNGKSAETIESRTSLVAGSHPGPQDTIDLNPHDQILDGLGRQSEPIDRFSAER